MCSPRNSGITITALILLLGSMTRAGTTIPSTWNTDAVGNWTDGTKWSTSPVFPDNGVDTFDAIIDSTDADVTLNADIAIRFLSLSAGTLRGESTLDLTDGFDWTGGALSGTGVINVAGSLFLAGVEKRFSQWTINLDPASVNVWQSGQIDQIDSEGGVMNNAGSFEDQTDDGWFWNVTQTPVFNNTGSYIKSNGSAGFAKSFWPAFNNDGFVDVQISGIEFAGGGHSTGSFSVAADAILRFSDFNELYSASGAPTTTFAASAVIDSQGTVLFGNNFGNAISVFAGTYDSALTVVDPGTSGVVTFAAGATVNSTDQGDIEVLSGTVRFQTGNGPVGFGVGNISGGELAGSDSLFFDELNWSGGTIRGAVTNDITTGQVIVGGSDPKRLIDVRLFNGVGSDSQITGTGAVEFSNAVLINLANGSIDIADGVVISNIDVANSSSTIVNAGLFTKSAGAGVAEILEVEFHNDGEVRAESGALRLAGGGTHTGLFTISAGATLEFDAAFVDSTFVPHELQAGASVSGPAGSTLRITGQTTFAAGSAAAVDRLDVSDGLMIVDSAAAVNVTTETRVLNDGVIQSNAGSFQAAALIVSGSGEVQLAAGANKVLRTTSVVIETASGSRIDLDDNAMVVDYSGSSPLTSIAGYIATAYSSGAWTGGGITSSSANANNFAVGFAERSSLTTVPAIFGTVDADAVLVRYTRYGDADLSATVNSDDFNRLASSFGLSGKVWSQGDFNFDNIVNSDDFNLLAGNFGLSAGADGVVDPQDWAALAAVVPEPGGFLLCGVAALAAMFRATHRHRPRKMHIR
jgi:hypothetical protein